MGVVVQPGVEFGDAEVFHYDREKAAALCRAARAQKGIVLEGHSTDYQSRAHLRQMAEDGIAILKVGPAFTFSMREAMFALESIEQRIYSDQPERLSNFRAVLEKVMLENPSHWAPYYKGSEKEQAISRAYSFYDRARYYMSLPEIVDARAKLLDNLAHGEIPLCMLSQYLPTQYYRVRAGELENNGEAILLDRIGDRIDAYLYATKNNGEM